MCGCEKKGVGPFCCWLRCCGCTRLFEWQCCSLACCRFLACLCCACECFCISCVRIVSNVTGYDFDDIAEDRPAAANKSVAKTAADPPRRPSALAVEFAEDIEFGHTSLADLGESRPFERHSSIKMQLNAEPGQTVFASSVQREIAR